jgi:hypothetical protein
MGENSDKRCRVRGTKETRTRRPRVHVVEDSPTLRETLAELLAPVRRAVALGRTRRRKRPPRPQRTAR